MPNLYNSISVVVRHYSVIRHFTAIWKSFTAPICCAMTGHHLIKNDEDSIIVKENISSVKRFYPFVAFYKQWLDGHQDLGDEVELSHS